MNERGELFTLDEQLNAANKECDELIEENTKLQAQVSSLTKERDELKNDIEKRMQVADKIFKENRDLNSQLSNRDKEIEEMKKGERYVFQDDGFDNYEFIPVGHFLENVSEDFRTAIAQGRGQNNLIQVHSIETLGTERTAYYTFDGKDCHLFLDEQEALASLQSKEGEE